MTKSLVVDASFTFKLLFPGPLQATVHELMTEWVNDGYTLYAPTLWVYETTSALYKMINLTSLTPDEGQRALTLAQGLGVQLIPPNDAQTRLALSWTVRLDRTAAYDSFYLALAETLRCELWTADKRLRNAANQPWVRGIDDI
jgi:predicted nucleic acid-binding protein